MSNPRDVGAGERADMSNLSSRGHSIFRGKPNVRRGKWSGRGKGSKPKAPNLAPSAGGQEEATIPVRLRPTHFLALPLNNHPSLMARINALQMGLFSKADGLHENFFPESAPSPAQGKGKGVIRVKSSLVRGLDSSIVIDPRRLHMTLGVMALEQDLCPVAKPMPEETIPTINQDASNSSSTPMANIQPTASTVLSNESPTCLPAGPLMPSDSSLTQSQPFLPSAPLVPATPLGDSTRKTVSTALALLNSLKPRISEILDSDKGVKIPLEVMHVLKTERMWINKKAENRGTRGKKEEVRGGERSEADEDGARGASGPAHGDHIEGKKGIGAGVLYVAPEMKNDGVNADLDKLIQVSDLVHNTFKAAGYLTDRRPLKLHCTILNTSHRKPSFRQPFSYSDVLASSSLPLFCGNASDSNSQSISMEESPCSSIQPNLSTSALQLDPSVKSSNVPSGHSEIKNLQPVSVNLGTFTADEIQLWIMGSHGPNNEYVSCGGVLLE